MSSNRRFYSEVPLCADCKHHLTGGEHQHLAKVLRAQPGDQVTLFDGSGFEFDATVETVRRNETELHITTRREADRELPFELCLAVALPKGDRQQWLVEKAVELGVTALLPLKTEFGVAQPGDKARLRMNRWIVAAAKQCGRNRLMHILDAATPAELLAQPNTESVFVAHPTEAVDLRGALREVSQVARQVVMVGPEGGFSGREIELARDRGCKIVSLGPRIMRIETAAVVMASALIYALHHE